MNFSFEIRTVKIGPAWLAGTTVGGVQLRGRRADTLADAVRALLWRMAQRDDDDAATAIDLAVEGLVLSDAFGELEPGD